MVKLSFVLYQAKELIQKVRPTRIDSNKNKLTGKVALLTGGASGIGYSIAKSFLKNGLSAITIADIDERGGCCTIKDLSALFGEERVIFMKCDVTKANELDCAFQQTLRHFCHLDIVINNAGIMNDSAWDEEVHTNLGGCLNGSLLSLQYMSNTTKGKGGVLINVSSIIGLMPSYGFPIHTMTQYGIVGLSRALGGHCKRTGVRVITVCPGLTQSELVETAHKKTLNENFNKFFCKEVEGCCVQHPDSVGDGIVEIIDTAKSGSVWFIENNDRPQEIRFPKIEDMINEKLL